MPQKIKFSSLDETYGSTLRAQETIFRTLTNEFFASANRELIIARTLELFNFKNPPRWNDLPALEKACVKVLTAATWYKNGRMDEDLSSDNIPYAPLEHYFEHILGFYKMPSSIFARLDGLVRADLKEIMILIDRYETQEQVVKDFLKTGEKRGEHEGKVRLDFYFRCLKEKDTIVKFLLNEVADRAVYRARMSKEVERMIPSLWRDHDERPYRWANPLSRQYFDYRQINTFKHRLNPIGIRPARKMGDLYQAGKEKLFYRELKKLLPPKIIFKRILETHIPANPKVQQRAPIFSELWQLLKKRHWFGFTALALTQVEGIFSDMVNITDPSARLSSLPNKVFAIREHYDYHESSFDYFEYVLPRIRNRFLHSGNAAGHNFQVLAYDLLYDLEYLLGVFLELRDDQVRLNNMLNGNMADAIGEIHDLLELFEIVERLRDKRRKNPGAKELGDVLAQWDAFESGELKELKIIERYTEQMTQDLARQTTNLFLEIYNFTTYSDTQLDLLNWNSSEIKERLTEISQVLKPNGYQFNTQFQLIRAMHLFLQRYSSFLPSISAEVKAQLIALKKSEKDSKRTAKIELLAPVFD